MAAEERSRRMHPRRPAETLSRHQRYARHSGEALLPAALLLLPLPSPDRASASDMVALIWWPHVQLAEPICRR